MKTKRILSVALALLIALALFTPASAEFSRREAPAWVDLDSLRRQHNIVGTIVLGRRETSFAVLQDGALVFEEYADGFDANSIHPMNSVTKSFAATMIGVAIQDGYIDCISQKVIDFFPDATIAEGQESKRDMTIEHLLTMRAGLPWIAQRGSLDFIHAEDSGLTAFETPQRHPPGERFIYDGGAGMQILVAVIERASGRCYYEYIRERIFEPLGMTSAHWDIFTQDGRVTGAMGLYMNTHDMLRYGQLHLQDGVWDGERILPEGWTDRTWENEEFAAFGLLPFNLLWWGNSESDSAGVSSRAQGFAGQLISVYPETGLVVARTGGAGRVGDGAGAWPLILNNGRFLYLFP